MDTLTVAVRLSDGAVLHVGNTSILKLKQLAGGNVEEKWRHVVRQLLHHRRSCVVRLIVGVEEEKIAWEEMTFRAGSPVEGNPLEGPQTVFKGVKG